MILLDRLKQQLPAAKPMLETATALRVHKDVVELAFELVARDADKLTSTLDTMFFPDEVSWIEYPVPDSEGRPGDMGIMFAGTPDVRKGNAVYYAWRQDELAPAAVPFKVDFERGILTPSPAFDDFSGKVDPIMQNRQFATLRPIILALLALINSPKMVKRVPQNLAKLNRKRAAVGKYTYHPHHTVRLNVDRKSFTVGEGSGGDGASRALHFVRAHLRLVNGSYILVKPHWRGDPAVGIRSTSYEVDRQNSKWAN